MSQDSLSETHRIIIPKDSPAKERLICAQQTLSEVQQDHPEILGITIFGSSVSGRARPDSDIDGYLFINAEVLPPESVSNIIEKDKFGDDRRRIRLSPELVGYYYQIYNQKLQNTANLAPDQVKHIRPLPISPEIVNTLIQDYIDYHGQLEQYRYRQQEINQLLDNHITDIPPRLPFPPEPQNKILYGLFHISIGHGLESYRNQVFELLEVQGEKGDLIWQNIITDTIGMETKMGNDPRSSSIYYPRTVSEAKQIYHH